jgi:hypothetical protein
LIGDHPPAEPKPFGAAKARVPIHFREHLSNNHFHENFSKKNRQIIPIKSEAGVRQ